MKYSVTCPAFLINPCIISTSCGKSQGKRKCRIGTIKRDVCSEENIPVDIQKITPIQRITGSQYCIKFLCSEEELGRKSNLLYCFFFGLRGIFEKRKRPRGRKNTLVYIFHKMATGIRTIMLDV